MDDADPKKWSEFLKNLHELLSTYQFQEDVSKYNVRKLDDWGKTGKQEGILVYGEHMPQFLSIIQNYNIDVSHVNKTEIFNHSAKLVELDEILQHTLKHWSQSNCKTGKTLRVQGDFIKIKDIDLEECNKRNKSTVNLKTLEIIATDTIFIDADFASTDPEFSLVIIAPKWSVIGTRTIKLDGEDAQPLNLEKAEAGLHGQPGLPGKPGGNFLGIAQTIINGTNLTITSNGGQGSRGQDGGDGLTGGNGRDATTDTFGYYLEHEKIGGSRWRIYGEAGRRGETGRNGGKGGVGGSAGQLIFFNFGKTGVKVEARRGDEGAAGIGGQGGSGGKNGNNLDATYIICCWSDEEEVKNGKTGRHGEQGSDGVNETGRIKSDDAKETNFCNSISEFKVIFRKYLKKKSYTKGDVQRFLSNMDLSPEIVNYLKIEGIVNDYERLEAQFRQSYDNHVQLFPFYENLKKVVERQVPGNEDEKIVLFHLYTTILSKLDIIDERRVDGYFIIKIESFLDTQIEKYRRWQRYGGDDVFQEYYVIQKDGIDNLIEQTKNFIKEFVIDDITHKLTENHNDQFGTTMKNTRNYILKMVAELLQNLENMGLEFNKIISDTNHISKLLTNTTEVKVPKEEISSIRAILKGTQITHPTIDADKFKDVEGAEKQVNQLKMYGKSIEDSIAGVLQQVTEDVSHFEAQLKAKSLSTLDVTKWQIPTVLKRIKYFVKQLPKDEVSNTLEGLNLVIDIYKRIENFYRLKKIANYVKLLDSTEWASKLKNDSLSGRLTKLKEHTIANLLISQYENNVDIIRQYAFPYVDELFKKYKLRFDIISQSDNFTAFLYKNIDNIDSLKYSAFHSLSDIAKYEMTVNGYNYRQPAFIWSHHEYQPSFKKLFSGEKILLKADSQSDQRNAVHFKWVEIHFKAINESNQKIIDDTMEDFAIDLTHIGNSYYKCDNKKYLVTATSLRFWYGIARSGNMPYGRRTYNGVYEKIHESVPIASPYATWILKLVSSNPGISAPYHNLSNFHELVDLQLIVCETYFKKHPSVCGRNIDDFYELDDPFPSLETLDTSRRNRRDTEIALTSAGSSLSSPINNMFKWISSSVGLSIGPVTYFGNLATKSLEGVSKSTFLNPVSFFDQVNSLLILAPVLFWLGKNVFNRNSDSIEDNNEVKIQDSRIESWKSFLETFRKLLLKYRLPVRWLWVHIEEIADEMDLARSKDEAERFETRLIILFVDFLEDIQYDPAFVRVKFDENFLRDVNKLVERAVVFPYFAYKLNML